MRLFVIRHGIAEETSASGSDADRALTADGRDRIARIAKALRKLELVAPRVATSPYVRARETAEIVCREWRVDPPAEVDELTPDGDAANMVGALRRLAWKGDLAIVGHMPSAAIFVSACLGSTREALDFKKGGVAILDFPGEPALGRGTLEYFLAPKILL